MKFTINGRLDNLNDYTKACRGNRYAGNKMKQKNEQQVVEGIVKAVLNNELKPIDKYPIQLEITWFEPNTRRDIDNLVFATKFIQDAMVKMKIIVDDSQKYINGLAHKVLVDKDNPRIEVVIHE